MGIKLSQEMIEGSVSDAAYHRFDGTTVTVCCITLENGFNVIGQSACIDPENFDAEIGMNEAYKDALNKVWQLQGFRIKQALHEAGERIGEAVGSIS